MVMDFCLCEMFLVKIFSLSVSCVLSFRISQGSVGYIPI